MALTLGSGLVSVACCVGARSPLGAAARDAGGVSGAWRAGGGGGGGADEAASLLLLLPLPASQALCVRLPRCRSADSVRRP